MWSLKCLRRAAWVGLLVFGLGVFAACDVPTSAPSVDTETGLNAPVVSSKTFTFLGGPQSQHEPLVDTTTSQFDSLFTVSESDQSLAIEEEVSSFDIGSLDQALDEATEGIGANTAISEAVIPGSDLATQDVSASFREENGRPQPTPPAESDPLPVAETTVPFPPGLLAIPNYELADIDADTIRRGTLTGETTFDGTGVNEVTFTLFNDPLNPTPLTDADGNPPEIQIRDETGTTIATATFDETISAGESASAAVGVEGETLGEDSELVLNVVGSDNDPEDELTVELSPLRYEEATVAGINDVTVSATEDNLSARGGGSSSQFAGIETRSGTLQLDITNNLQFPIQVDSLLLENNLQNSALPDSFDVLDVFRSTASIAAGATQTFEVDLEGRGIASGIDVRVAGGLADDRDVVTAAASDNIDVSAGGELTIGAMFFWPEGEEVQAGGAFDFEQDRIRFDQPSDFVELEAGRLALDNLVSEPMVGFDSFVLSFPDIRDEPYGPRDSLTVPFSVPTGSTPEIDDVDLANLRLSPTNGVVEYNLQGTLETIPPSEQDPENLRVIRFEDAVRADVVVDELDVRALDTGVSPFSVDVTEDANGDGQLDLADNAEATRESFDGFDGIAESINGLQLSGSELKFQVTTDAGTDAQLFAALKGRGGGTQTFLAGRGDKRVTASDPLGDDFFDGGTQIARDNLIQFGIDGAPADDPVTRSITLTGDNSSVDDFISTLPDVLRFVAQARLTGDDDGQIRLRRPLQFDAGLSVSVPVTVNGSFAVEDTVEADFSSLEDVTDPEDDFSISTAELRLKYANQIPLGADAILIVLGENGSEVLTLPSGDDRLRLDPAPKADDGTAQGSQTGTATLDLSKEEVMELADGREIRLVFDMDQAEDGGGATLRATDTIEVSLEAEINATITTD